MAQLNEKIQEAESPELSLTTGEDLKQVRISRKLTTQQVSETLRISERYIIAIEEQDTRSLPEQVYTLGFVRTYSLFMGLDPNKTVNDFKQAISATKGTILDFPVPEKSSSAPRAAAILISLVAAGVIYALWAILEPASETKPVTIVEKPIIPQAQPTPTPVIDNVPGAQPAPAAVDENNFVGMDEFFVMPGQQLNITASQLSWVEIRDKNNQVLLNANLNAGETKSIMITDSVTISTGNAGGISLSTGNFKTKALGAQGQVLHYFQVPFKVLS